MIFYTIYKITNLLNGKYYIGKHQTKNLDDGYMGSGKLLKRAIAKYGIEHFKKEILHIFDNEFDMNAKEKELVIVCEHSYNLNEGGQGGFSYINRNNLNAGIRISDREQKSNAGKIGGKETHTLHNSSVIAKKGANTKKSNGFNFATFKNKKHSKETIEKISKTIKLNGLSKGTKNSQYGTYWITNGLENKKIKKEQPIPDGWFKGRKCRI